MKNLSILLLLSIFIFSCTTQQLNQVLGDILEDGTPTTSEVGSGLKEALTQGITKGANLASMTDGFFGNSLIRIPFPPEVAKVETRLRQIGLDKEVDKFVLALNRGAENASKEAVPIFVNAIKQMTIQDAWAILRGEKDAATQYLERVTSSELRAKFQPVIKVAIDNTNATKIYGDLVNTYNRIPLVEKVNPNLDEYATEKALQGLFTLVRQEEANIRENPAMRSTNLLKKVFGYKG
jgi:hypothetical protein